MVGFSKYKFYNKLLIGVIFFRVTLSVTWTQLYISWFNVNFNKFTVRLHCIQIFFMLSKFQGDQRLIGMSSINCQNSSFSSLKECIKIWVYRSNGKLHPIGMKISIHV